MLLLWQSLTCLQSSHHQALPFCRPPCALFPPDRISRRLGHTMGRDDGVRFAAGERALQRGSYECGPCRRHVLGLWHVTTASLLSSDLTHRPQLLIRSHIRLLGWITERKSAWTLYFKTVTPLSPPSIHPQFTGSFSGRALPHSS